MIEPVGNHDAPSRIGSWSMGFDTQRRPSTIFAVSRHPVFEDVELGAEEAEKPEVTVLAITLKTVNRVWIGGEEHEL